jgi:hypothetical protein
MSENSRAVMSLGQSGIVASIDRQLAITEKLVGSIQSAQRLLDVLKVPQDGSFEDACDAIAKYTNTHAKEVSSPDIPGLVSEFDDQLYDRFKPHLDKMWLAAITGAVDANVALKNFIRDVMRDMGRGFLPYAKKFYYEIKASEVINESNKAQANEVVSSDKLDSGPEIDDMIYEQLKPHLNKAWEVEKTAYGDNPEALDSFVNKFIGAVGEKVLPYMKKFYREVRIIAGSTF